MDIGRKIYYGKSNGVILYDTGERSGDVIPTTTEEDMAMMPSMQLLPPEEIGLLQLEYGQQAEQFSHSKGYIVNPETGQLVFLMDE